MKLTLIDSVALLLQNKSELGHNIVIFWVIKRRKVVN